MCCYCLNAVTVVACMFLLPRFRCHQEVTWLPDSSWTDHTANVQCHNTIQQSKNKLLNNCFRFDSGNSGTPKELEFANWGCVDDIKVCMFCDWSVDGSVGLLVGELIDSRINLVIG